MKEWLRDLLAFYRSESKGFLFLGLIICLFLVWKATSPLNYFTPGYKPISFDSLRQRDLQQFENRLHEIISFKETFDPNNLDSIQWQQLGMSARQAGMLTQICERRNFMMQSQDFERIVFLKPLLWKRLQPYLKFPDKPEYKKKFPLTATIKSDAEVTIPQGLKIDINVSTRSQLDSLGLSDYQVRNILSWRNKGGKFYSSDDLLKLHTLKPLDVSKIEPYLTFATPRTKKQLTYKEHGGRNSKNNYTTQTLDINTCDSAQLVALPFIGPYYAARILQFRKHLGGFYSIEQLYEVKSVPEHVIDSIISMVSAGSDNLMRFPVNSATYEQMIKHPYFDDYHIKQTIKLRKQLGKFISLSQLDSIPFVDTKRVELMKKYLSLD